MSKNEQVTETPDLPPLPDPNVPVGGEPPVAAPVEAPTVPPPVVAYPAQPAVAYPAQPVAPIAVGPRTEGKAVAALVCAILSWFIGPIVLAIVALVLSSSAEKAIDATPAELTGRGLVSGARWVAWFHLVLAAMVIAFLSAFAIALWIGR
ncbi:MAG: hypothetical protein LH645_06110 [Actinomycetia bacterium]|nr:hypothetical protein [Actinomycetes bacterium]